MTQIKVTFEKLHQDSHDLGSTDEIMVSRVFYSVEANGQTAEAHSDLKQAVGSQFEGSEASSIEVGPPVGYSGPFNAGAFQKAAEDYYRGTVGSGGWAIRAAPGANIRMRDNVFQKRVVVVFDAKDEGRSW